MYKVHFENRFVMISPEPDRLQKYGLFHKFHDAAELYKAIAEFQADETVSSMNIYGSDIKHLWKVFRLYFTQVFAAGGLVRHTSGRYLFIERKGKLDLPKGHLEKGEETESCALREVAEECGITGHTIVKQVGESYHTYSWEGITYLKKTTWYLMNYDGEMVCTPQIEEGVTRVDWLYPDELCDVRGRAWQSLSDLINDCILRG